MTSGPVIRNSWNPGLVSYGPGADSLHLLAGSTSSGADLATEQTGTLSPLEYLASYIPRSIVAPFSTNNVMGVVLLALFLGAALRRLRGKADREGGALNVLVWIIERLYVLLVQMLGWIILA